MNSDCRIEDKSDYVLVTYSGSFDEDRLLGILANAVEQALEQDKPGVMVDVLEIPGPVPNVFERFNIGSRIADLQRSKKKLIKIGVIGKEPIIDPNRFAETVALNRYGLVKVSTDRKEIENWMAAR